MNMEMNEDRKAHLLLVREGAGEVIVLCHRMSKAIEENRGKIIKQINEIAGRNGEFRHAVDMVPIQWLARLCRFFMRRNEEDIEELRKMRAECEKRIKVWDAIGLSVVGMYETVTQHLKDAGVEVEDG